MPSTVCRGTVISEAPHNSGRDQRERLHRDVLPPAPPTRRNSRLQRLNWVIGDVAKEMIEGV